MNIFPFIFLLLLHKSVYAKDANTINFIKLFIQNDQKPTHLIYGGLCWKKNVINKLVVELSTIGVRTSASFKPKSKYQDHAILYLTDLDCAQSKAIISYALSKELFQFTYRWLVLVTSPQLQQSKISLLMNGSVLVDSDLVLAERVGNHFKMVEMHRPGLNGSMITTPRGFYNGSFVDVRPHRELYRRRRNMMGHPITMSNVIQDSNSTREHLPKEDRLELQYDSITKACWSAAKIGFEMINATAKYIFSYRYGYKVDGQWSGMIADLYSNKADVGTNCVIFRDRFDVVTYTDLVAPMRMLFIFRQPPLAYVANVFYLPFSTRVWVTIAVCTAIATVTLYLASKVELVLTKVRQLDGGICDALLLTMSAVTQQGCYIEPRRAPGRMMVFVLFTALMALYAAYSANIVVLLQAPSDSIRSLPQLANAKITLAANDVDYNHFVFVSSPILCFKEPLHTSIRDRVFPENGKARLYSLADGVERIRKGLFALHSVAEPVYRQIEATFLESEKCDIATVDYLVTFDSFTPVRKGSPYLELIRVVHKQIRESGIQSAIRKRFLVSKPHCTTKMSSFSSVGLMDMRPVLILMLYGVAVSVTIVIGEIAVYKLMNRYKRSSKVQLIKVMK
ncbi:glutamate receptor-like [Helicoverpa armigera]|uniref:glutamate receptor-like n=1 Tax=Helicoverpa armigera TaxID=29058 RepID=UPI003083B934